MKITISKHRLGCILALVQLYGEFLNFFKFLAFREKEIHQTTELEPNELEELLRIRVQMDLALMKIATELSEKHGVCIPGPTGWETPDRRRFFKEPLASEEGFSPLA